MGFPTFEFGIEGARSSESAVSQCATIDFGVKGAQSSK